MSTMIGVDVSNSRLDKFQKSIQKGDQFMMVVVPRNRIDAVDELVKKHHPEAEIGALI